MTQDTQDVRAGAATGTSTLDLKFVSGDSAQPASGLFRVEVDGLLGFSLIPLNDLARDLAGAWMAGEKKVTLSGVTPVRTPWTDSTIHTRGHDMRVDRLAIRIEPGNILSHGGDPFYTGQRISDEERAVALAAIDGLREAKRETRITVEKLAAASKRAKPTRRNRR